MLSLVLAGAMAAVAPAQPPPWLEAYQRGVQLVEAGDGETARAELERSLRLGPEPQLGVPLGSGAVDFLPHLYLAMASHMAGDPAAARRHLELSREAGVAARSEVGAPLLEAWSLLLGPSPESPEPTGEQGFRDYSRPPATEEERTQIASIEREVMARCALPAGQATSGAPWYYHYELGLELLKGGHDVRALDAFIEAVDTGSRPRHSARIYGMWFVDYLPYFHIARAHSRLGNWACAGDAMRMSESWREISPEDREYDEFRELAKLIADGEGEEP
jgi:hypothetical protein